MIHQILQTPILLIKRALALPLPLSIFGYEITKVCNGSCIYCDYGRRTIDHLIDLQDQLTLEELHKGLKPPSLFKNIKEVHITGGEPYLRKDMVAIIQFLAQLSPKALIQINTNGLTPNLTLRKTTELGDLLGSSRLLISVSLDGPKDINNFQRGSVMHYDQAMKTICLLRENEFNVAASSVITKMNLPKMKSFHNSLFSLGIPHYLNLFQNYGSRSQGFPEELALGPEDVKLFEELSCVGDYSLQRRFLSIYLQDQRQLLPCFGGFNSFTLYANGDVFPCGPLHYRLGNIREQPFGSIWLGPRAKKARKYIRQGLCHCTDCFQTKSILMTPLFSLLKFLSWEVTGRYSCRVSLRKFITDKLVEMLCRTRKQ